MRDEIKLVKEFHKKYNIPVGEIPQLLLNERSDVRFRVMDEEVSEYREGTKNEDLENIAKELADILYTVYGTIIEHGLSDIMPEVFGEVHKSNMTKDLVNENEKGLKKGFKIKKGKDYKKADLSRFF